MAEENKGALRRVAEKACAFKEQKKADYYAGMATLTYGALMTPGIAFADVSADDMLGRILSLASTAVSLLGGALIVWGGVKFGLAIKDHQGGNSMAESLATVGGGAIIVAAGVYFSNLASSVSFGS